MTELEFALTIIFRKYPAKVAFLILNELLGAVLVVAGIGTIVPLLGSLTENSSHIPGKLGKLIVYTGLDHAGSGAIMTVLIVILAGRYALDAVRGYIAGSIAVDLNQTLKSEINFSVSQADWVYFINENHGRYIQCMAVESSTSSGAVNDLAGLVANAVLLVFMLVTMVFFSLSAVALTGLVAIWSMSFSKILMRKSKDVGIERLDILNELNNFILDNKSIMKLLKAEGLEDQRSQIAEALIIQTSRVEKKQVAYALGIDGYNNIFILIVLALLSYLYLGLHFGDGASLIFNILLIQRAASYLGSVQQKRRSMLQKIPSYVSCLAIIEDAKAARRVRQGTAIPEADFSIALENVSFTYPDGTPALANVNLILPSKGLAALVGRSGSGKTTVVDLILGLMVPNKGQVRIGNASLQDIDYNHWQDFLTYVPQNAYLMKGTLRDNMTLGVKNANDAKIWRALEKTDCAKLVKSLPNGLDTNVKLGGGNFSGGERQKFSMARALLRHSRILILDEPSASLDKDSEREIRLTIEKLSNELLVIVVTHSPEFIQGIGQVFMIDQGMCIWQGSSYELSQSHNLLGLLKDRVEK